MNKIVQVGASGIENPSKPKKDQKQFSDDNASNNDNKPIKIYQMIVKMVAETLQALLIWNSTLANSKFPSL